MTSRHYINNRDLFECTVIYRKAFLIAREQGKPKPIIPRYVGECIMQLCDKMGSRYNFSNYSYRDEMVDDAIEDCIGGYSNFDPEKSQNVFGFLSRIAWRAMLRRIADEQKETYIRHKNGATLFSQDQHYVAHPHWDDPRAVSALDKMKGNINGDDLSAVGSSQEVIDKFEERMAAKKRSSKATQTDLTSVSPEIREVVPWLS